MTLLESLSEFNKMYILPALNRLDAIRKSIEDGTHENIDIKYISTVFLGDYLVDDDIRDISGLPGSSGTVKYRGLGKVSDIKVAEVRQLSSDILIVLASCVASVRFSVHLDYDDLHDREVQKSFGPFEDEEYSGPIDLDSDTNACIEFTFLINHSTGDIEDMHIDSIG